MMRAIGTLSRVGALVTVATALVSVAGCGSGPVAAPTTYAAFNSGGGTFACEYPEGWQADGGGKRGLEWAKFTSDPAEIRIDAGAVGSLVAGPNTTDEELPPELQPIHGLHEAGQEDAENKYSGYKEVGEIEVFEAPLGPARRSEFTAATTFGSGLHGYRATLLGKDKAVYAFCVCPESDWKTLQPAFDKVLVSLKRGQAE